MPLIKENGRIVVTASGVHDPDSPGGAQGVPATIGDLSGFEKAVMTGDKRFDMVDGGQFNADKAYKDSKLCNVLFTRELQRRLDDRRSSVKVNCFNPGLIVGRIHLLRFAVIICATSSIHITSIQEPVSFEIKIKSSRKYSMLQQQTCSKLEKQLIGEGELWSIWYVRFVCKSSSF